MQKTLSNSAFLLLFPGFFLYQSAIGLNIFPPFLGGYFGIVTLFLFPVLMLFFIMTKGNVFSNFNVIDILFFIIMILVVTVSVSNYFYGKPSVDTERMLIWSLSGVLFNLMCYLLARMIDLDSRVFLNALIISQGIMACIVFFNINSDLGIFYLLHNNPNQSLATYQGFARSLLVVGLLVVPLVKSMRFRVAVFLLSAIALFFNGARTEFALFVLSCLALAVYKRKLSLNVIIILTTSVIVMFLLLTVSLEQIYSFLPNNRMIEMFRWFEGSTSYASRMDATIQALEVITVNPWLGDYGYYVEEGGLGSYSHNLLSAWVNLGLFGFLLHVLVMLGIMLGLVCLKSRNLIQKDIVILYLSVVLMGYVFSKDYSYMLFGLLVGFYSRYRSAIVLRVYGKRPA